MLCVLDEWKILSKLFLSKPPVKAELGMGKCQLGREVSGKRERENQSPLQNEDVQRTHSFLTAWCTSVRPWGSSSGPWGRPESAWSWGEKTAQRNAISSWHRWGGELYWTSVGHGGNHAQDTLVCWRDHSPLPCLQFDMWCWKASEMPSIWVCDITPGRWCFFGMLWTVQNEEFPQHTVLLIQLLFLASDSQHSELAASPNPFSGCPRSISRDWDCLEIFEQNISVSEGEKKKKKFVQDHTLL